MNKFYVNFTLILLCFPSSCNQEEGKQRVDTVKVSNSACISGEFKLISTDNHIEKFDMAISRGKEGCVEEIIGLLKNHRINEYIREALRKLSFILSDSQLADVEKTIAAEKARLEMLLPKASDIEKKFNQINPDVCNSLVDEIKEDPFMHLGHVLFPTLKIAEVAPQNSGFALNDSNPISNNAQNIGREEAKKLDQLMARVLYSEIGIEVESSYITNESAGSTKSSGELTVGLLAEKDDSDSAKKDDLNTKFKFNIDGSRTDNSFELRLLTQSLRSQGINYRAEINIHSNLDEKKFVSLGFAAVLSRMGESDTLETVYERNIHLEQITNDTFEVDFNHSTYVSGGKVIKVPEKVKSAYYYSKHGFPSDSEFDKIIKLEKETRGLGLTDPLASSSSCYAASPGTYCLDINGDSVVDNLDIETLKKVTVKLPGTEVRWNLDPYVTEALEFQLQNSCGELRLPDYFDLQKRMCGEVIAKGYLMADADIWYTSFAQRYEETLPKSSLDTLQRIKNLIYSNLAICYGQFSSPENVDRKSLINSTDPDRSTLKINMD